MRVILLFSLLLGYHISLSQDTIVTYFNSEWEEVKQEEADYFRKATKNNGRSWKVYDYYSNNQLQMIGTYATQKLKKRNGYFKYFYENGSLKSHGQYKKDKRVGVWKWYRDNSTISSIERYAKDELKEFSFWNEDGSQIEGDIQHFVHAQFVGSSSILGNHIQIRRRIFNSLICSHIIRNFLWLQ